MTKTEELIIRSQAGDRAAKEQLISENTGLIWSVARRYIGRGTDADDLYQLGCLGFLKAIDGFDINFGTQFSTYAVPKISGEIRRYLRDDGAVKVSRGIKERATLIKAVRNQLTHKFDREPTIHEIASHTGLSVDDIAFAEGAMSEIESIQQFMGNSSMSLESMLSDTDSEDIIMERVVLKQALERLPERDALVIKLRYYHGLTQQRVAKVLDVSQVQVSRLEKKALLRLRELLE